MEASRRQQRSVRAAATWRAAAIPGAVLALAACSMPDGGAESVSPSPSISTAVATSEDEDLATHVGSFLPDIDGFSRFPPGPTEPFTAAEYFGDQTITVEPASCRDVLDGSNLGTSLDLTAAAGDLVQHIVYLTDDEATRGTASPEEPRASVLVRIFSDEELGAQTRQALISSECSDYTHTWPEDGIRVESAFSDTVLLDLSDRGLDEPLLRMDRTEDRYSEADATGEYAPTETYPPSVTYVYIDGPWAIGLWFARVDGTDAIATAIVSDFVAHMEAGAT